MKTVLCAYLQMGFSISKYNIKLWVFQPRHFESNPDKFIA
jgi:hypothetical protein